jgi:hypothetical protein
MIRHMVLLRIRSDVDAATLIDIFGRLHGLQTQLDGIVDVRSGRDASPEGMARGYTHGFTVDFVDAAARDRYLVDARHQAVGALLVGACEGGVGGILVLDFAAP